MDTEFEVLQIYQRTCFERKSQHTRWGYVYFNGCYKYTKELVLKGNHNAVVLQTKCLEVLQIYQRTCFERKSQPDFLLIGLTDWCYKYTKELVLKGNHNHDDNAFCFWNGVTNIPKNLFWKEITTLIPRNLPVVLVLQIYQRTCFERKSQRRRNNVYWRARCYKYTKELVLKANHNECEILSNIFTAPFNSRWFF